MHPSDLISGLQTLRFIPTPDGELYTNQIFRSSVHVIDSSLFVRCMFEDCGPTDEGAIVSSGPNRLCVADSDFRRCSSNTKCGGLKKTEGSLVMRCSVFEECYGVNGDTNYYGTAMGASDCAVGCEDITFAKCWRQESPFADNTYGIVRGTADVRRINVTQCVSRGGGLSGCFLSVGEDSSISFLNCVNNYNNNALDVWNVYQVINQFNIINNTFTNQFMYIYNTKLTVYKGYFFKNTRYDILGSADLFDCISDSCPKATTNMPLSSVNFIAEQCRSSPIFTTRIEDRHLNILILYFLVF